MGPLFVLSNRLEAALWIGVAIGFSVAAMRRSQFRLDCIIGAIAFALFGVSDLVEATTGAWWRPWWLLAWKAACVLAFLWLLKRYINLRTPGCGSSTSSHRSARAENPSPSDSRSP
jgi:hypothetical protein